MLILHRDHNIVNDKHFHEFQDLIMIIGQIVKCNRESEAIITAVLAGKVNKIEGYL